MPLGIDHLPLTFPTSLFLTLSSHKLIARFWNMVSADSTDSSEKVPRSSASFQPSKTTNGELDKLEHLYNNADDKEVSAAPSPAEPNDDAGEKSAGPDHAEQPVYPTGLRLIAIIAALCLAVFLCALDQTILATATPKITDRFHSVDDIGWQVLIFRLHNPGQPSPSSS